MSQQHKLIKTDYDYFNILYKQGNDYLDASVIQSFISTQNIPMLVESVCHVLTICERFNHTTTSIATTRDPTLIGNRFALQSVIDALAINHGHLDTSSEYSLPLISLIFTYNPEALHFISLLRSAKNWTSYSFKQAFMNSPYFKYITTLQHEIPYVPFTLLTRFRVSRAIEYAFIKYAAKPPPITNQTTSTTTTTTSTTITNPHQFDILSSVAKHHELFTTQLKSIDNINKYLPTYFTNPLLSSQPKTLLYDDDVIELPIHIPTAVSEFSTYLIFSQFAGYGIEMKAFTEQIPQALLRYVSMAIQSYNFETFKYLISVDLYMNLDEEKTPLQPTKELDREKAIYNAASYSQRTIPLANPVHYDIKNYVPQPALIGNLIIDNVVTQILTKYSCIEKLTNIVKEIDQLTIQLSQPGQSKEIQTTTKFKIDTLKLKALSYYNQCQLVIRFHEGLWSLFRYDFATPSQLITLYLAAHLYQDTLILTRLQEHYGLTLENLTDYDNTTHLEKLPNDTVRNAYKIAITDTKFKQSRKTLIYDLMHHFSLYQLPRCIEYYVFTMKRKKTIADLSLPLNPIAIAITTYDVDIQFIQFLIDKGCPFIPHSRFGDQYNIILALLQSSYDQPQERTVELLDWCLKYIKESTKENIMITMDEFFAFMAKISRLPLQPPTTVAQVKENIQSYLTSTNSTQPLLPPPIPIDSPVALAVYPQPGGYRRKVLQWVYDNALDRKTWEKNVQTVPEVIVKAMGGLLQVNEPTPLSFAQNSIEFQFFEEDLLTILHFFITPETSPLLFKHQQFTTIIAQLLRHRSVRIFKFFFDNGYILDKQIIYLFAMAPPTFNDYNDFNIYIPTYRELVNSTDKNINAQWRNLEDNQIPYLPTEKVSSSQQGQRLIAEAHYITSITTKANKVKKKPTTVTPQVEPEPTTIEEVEFDENGDEIIKEKGDDKKDNDADLDGDDDSIFDDVDWSKLSEVETREMIEKIKLQFRRRLDRHNKNIEDINNQVSDEFTSYKVNYNAIPQRLPPQCPKFQSLNRFNMASKQGLSQLLASGILIDSKKDDVLAKLNIPKLQFDMVESICVPNQEQLYAQIKNRDQMEAVLNQASKKELGKCCWTVLQYLYKTYYLPYQQGKIPFSQQSSLISLLFLFIQHCPEIEYALYMLMTPVDTVGFVSTCFQWIFYKIVVETFPTARIPFSLLGKLYLLQGNPSRPTSSLATHLSTSLMIEDVIRQSIDGFNRYTISNRVDLSEENQEIYTKVAQAHTQALRKAIKQQQYTGKQPDIPQEPPSLSELGLQDFRYELTYHGTTVHHVKSPEELQEYQLDNNSPLIQFSPTNIITQTPSPLLPTSSKSQYINQRYFNMLSFDSQFQSSSSSSSSPTSKNNKKDSNAIYVSHIAQRALTSLVCDMLFQYKLDEEISKELQTHRDIREWAKATTSRDEFISSFTIFRRLFNYIRYIPHQIVFFFNHLIPTGDLYIYFDMLELQAFFPQTGRSGIFDQELMFIAQPIQYHVFPTTQTYRRYITDVLAKLYEFNPEYALNRVEDNVKLMSDQDPNAQQKQQQPEGTPPVEKKEVVPEKPISPYNMANFYTLYYDVPDNIEQDQTTGKFNVPTTNHDTFKYELLPQRNNIIVPHVIVDLSGSLLIEETAESEDEAFKKVLPKDLGQLLTLWVVMCESRRRQIFGNTPPPAEIPIDLTRTQIGDEIDISIDSDDDDNNDNNNNDNKTSDSELQQQINLSSTTSTTATSGGGYLLPICLAVASLAGIAAGAMFFISAPKSDHAPQRKQRKRGGGGSSGANNNQ